MYVHLNKEHEFIVTKEHLLLTNHCESRVFGDLVSWENNSTFTIIITIYQLTYKYNIPFNHGLQIYYDEITEKLGLISL